MLSLYDHINNTREAINNKFKIHPPPVDITNIFGAITAFVSNIIPEKKQAEIPPHNPDI
jgi:hypothetical protein